MFIIETKNTLPEQFRAGIDVTNKSLIAEKMYSLFFLSRQAYREVYEKIQEFPILFTLRIIEGYSITEYRGLSYAKDANSLFNFINEQREKNMNIPGRAWQPGPSDTIKLYDSFTTPDHVFQLLESNETLNHVSLDNNNVISKVQDI